MAYTDLREFIARSGKHGELKRIPFEVDPVLEITEFADRAVKRGGPALLFEKPKGSQRPGADQRLRHRCARWRSRSKWTRWRRSRGRIVGVPRDAHARRADRQAEDAAQAGRDGRVLPEDRLQRALQGSDPARRLLAARLPGPAVLARGRRPLHHAAAGLHAQSRHRQAQLRHVPHAGLRRAHHRHALADPQAGRRALPPPADSSGAQAHGRGGGHRRRPGHHVLGHPAAAAGPRRDDDRRLPARQSRSRW